MKVRTAVQCAAIVLLAAVPSFIFGYNYGASKSERSKWTPLSADITLSAAGLCRDHDEDSAPAINGFISAASQIQQITSPSSLAAAYDYYGTTVAVDFGGERCRLKSSILLIGSHNLIIQNGWFDNMGDDSVARFEFHSP